MRKITGGGGGSVLRELCTEHKYRQLRQEGHRTEGNNLPKEAYVNGWQNCG